MTTPVRRQYLDIKRQHPDAILFFRMGDFYETFDADAEIAARELEIVLTGRDAGRGQRIPMAGIPYHAAEGYIAKLVAKGYRVAICEQVSEPDGKGPVDRRVTQVISPGTVVQADQLAPNRNNYLAAVARLPDGTRGIGYLDLTTAEFAACTIGSDRLPHELARLRPAEILAADGDPAEWLPDVPVTRRPEWFFDEESAADDLRRHFGVATLQAFGCEAQPAATAAAGAVLRYIVEGQPDWAAWITTLRTYSPDAFMTLDAATRRNLELTAGARGTAEGSLIEVIDATLTPMGGRLLRRWLGEPLIEPGPLLERQAGVAAFVESGDLRRCLRQALEGLGDLERLTNRLSVGLPAARDLIRLRRTLERLPAIVDLASHPGSAAVGDRFRAIDAAADLAGQIAAAIVDEPPSDRSGLGAVRPGYSAELDRIRAAGADARTFIAAIEAAERDRTGLRTLKVGYNKVFGYYLEASQAALRQPLTGEARTVIAAHGHAAPGTMQEFLEGHCGYQRRQTLVGAERYITPDLKRREVEVATAQDRARALEEEVLADIGAAIAAARDRLLATARRIAEVDALAGLAEVAARDGWARPEISEDGDLAIEGGRHPVVERYLPPGEFVPNDLDLDDTCRIILLTGPNMAGKSTYLRQAALIVLLAQIGSFVPARRARVGLADRIFTRIGAQDDIVVGQSTFLVEMTETATILNHATPRSLVILDEIGRGTSTYDGLSIAQSVVEYLHGPPGLGCRTLFATHYHELTDLAARLPKVANHHVEVLEEGGGVVFLHRVRPGAARRSYGIEVAKLAGIPKPVVHRAEDILDELEGAAKVRRRPARRAPPGLQLALFYPPDPVLEELRGLDVMALSPLEALTKLYELAEQAKSRRIH